MATFPPHRAETASSVPPSYLEGQHLRRPGLLAEAEQREQHEENLIMMMRVFDATEPLKSA